MGFFLKLVTSNDPFERCKVYALKYGRKLFENHYTLTFHEPEGKKVQVSVMDNYIQLEVTDLKGDFFNICKGKVPVGKGYYYSVGTPDFDAPARSAIIKPTKYEIVSKEEAESLIEPWAKLLEKQYG